MVEGASGSAVSSWRFKLGVVCFVAAFAIYLITLAAIVAGASAATVGAIAAINFALNKVLLLLAVAIMGKPGFNRIKQLVLGTLTQYAPPREVGRIRYRVGLILFLIPIFAGWISPYLADIAPSIGRQSVTTAVLGDVALLISLFVLGGGFWDKLRSLFIRDAYATILD